MAGSIPVPSVRAASAVESLEGPENALRILLVESYTVVFLSNGAGEIALSDGDFEITLILCNSFKQHLFLEHNAIRYSSCCKGLKLV